MEIESLLPAPKGLDSLRSYRDASPLSATSLLNVTVEGDYLQGRKGFRLHALPAQSGACETLVSHSDLNGATRLLAGKGGKLMDATTFNTAPSVFVQTFTNNRWSTAQIGGYTVFCNGFDTSQKYSIATGLQTNTVTHASLTDPTKLRHVNKFRDRLYFLERDTGYCYELNTPGAQGGAATQLDFERIFPRGGPCLFTATFTGSLGESSDDFLIVGSYKGDVLAYKGAFSGSTTDPFRLVGVYQLAPFMGIRPYFKFGADLVLITEKGIIPLTALLSVTEATDYSSYAITNQIYRDFNRYAVGFSENLEWMGFENTNSDLLMINAPRGASYVDQLVINTTTQAWSIFSGINANVWCMHNAEPYFGGNDGAIYQADKDYTDILAGQSAKPYYFTINHAFTPFGNPQIKKIAKEVNLKWRASGPFSYSTYYSVDGENIKKITDYSIPYGVGTPWNTAPFGTFPWAVEEKLISRKHGLRGEGHFYQFGVVGNNNNQRIRYMGGELFYETAGIK